MSADSYCRKPFQLLEFPGPHSVVETALRARLSAGTLS